MPRARALVLDIGGVVLRNARELDLDRGVGGTDEERWQAMLRHELTERDYWALRSREVGDALGHDGWSTRELITWLYHQPDVEFVVEEMVDLMDDARAAGLPVVALTNDLTDFHGQEWVDAQEWLDHFDTVVDASSTGDLKPAPEAYAHGVAAAGVPAEEIVYLDDLPVNVAGARAVGLQTIEVQYDDRPAAIAEARRRLGLTPTDS
jgi:putative hydrolase of the HAD superfamily